MTLRDEHGPLLVSAEQLIDNLQGLEGRLQHGEVMHLQHVEFAQRSIWLAHQLSAALLLIEEEAYPAAFAVLRTTLEHHVIDWLLFLGDRYQQVFTGVSAEEWTEYQTARSAGEPWTTNIVDWVWRNGTLTVLRSGPHVQGQTGESLSIYYGFLSEFDPFHGHPEDQKYLTTDFTEPELHERWAEKQRLVWGQGFRWDSLRENLRLNKLMTDKELAQLGVHYRFLSAYVHPVSEGYRLLYTNNLPAKPPGYDHYASELGLLYANTIAARELTAFEEMASRPPRLGFVGRDEVQQAIRQAKAASSHLWFPGGTPHSFDRVQEANHRGLKNRHLVPASDPNRKRPEDLADDDIHYYRNPLTRLREMHRTQQEMTGFSFVSPWPRADAWR